MIQFRVPFLAVLAVAASAMLAVSAAQPEEPININTATVEELTELSGIGSTIAGRIVEWREENGPFSSTEELMNITGIGENTYEKIRQHVTVEEAAQPERSGRRERPGLPRDA